MHSHIWEDGPLMNRVVGLKVTSLLRENARISKIIPYFVFESAIENKSSWIKAIILTHKSLFNWGIYTFTGLNELIVIDVSGPRRAKVLWYNWCLFESVNTPIIMVIHLLFTRISEHHDENLTCEHTIKCNSDKVISEKLQYKKNRLIGKGYHVLSLHYKMFSYNWDITHV